MIKHKICSFLDYLCLRDRRLIWILMGPLLPMPFLFVHHDVIMYRCAFVAVWMCFYWLTEPIPIAATAFIPLLFFPLLGITSASKISKAYFNDTLFLLVVAMIFAAGLEKWQLHKKIALKFLMLFGNRPKVLLLGFMLITGIISMWISNITSTAMMIPLALAVLEQIESSIKKPIEPFDGSYRNEIVIDDPSESSLLSSDNSIRRTIPTSSSLEYNMKISEVKSYSTGLLLGIAYSASLGGTTTLIGSAPNIIFASQLKILFPKAPIVSFGKWFVLGTPMAFVVLILTWIIIVFKYARRTTFHVNTKILQTHYDQLGALNFAQIVIIIDFMIMVVLWFSRTSLEGDGSGGWSTIFANNYVTETTVAILGVFVLFIIPSGYKKPSIFDNDVILNTPWDIVFLMAGGFGLASGIQSSGLTDAISELLQFVENFPTFFVMVIVCLAVLIMTEFTSNSSTITVFCPLIAALSVAIKQNPLLLMIPATITSSYAFMLPVSTPPNAMVFSCGKMTVRDMVTTGGIINFIGLFIVPGFMLLYASFFDIIPNELPDWAVPVTPTTV